MSYQLQDYKQQPIPFVMIDGNGNEVSGLGVNVTVQLSWDGGAFIAGSGTVSELGNGWYAYLMPAAEAHGVISIKLTGAGCIQQNLVAQGEVVRIGAIEFTYTLLNTLTGLPVEAADVWISTDVGGVNILWRGKTNAFGIAKDDLNMKPFLDAGVYYFWQKKSGFTFTNPEIETVS